MEDISKFKIGDIVFVKKLDKECEIINIVGRDTYEVEFGAFKYKVKENEIIFCKKEAVIINKTGLFKTRSEKTINNSYYSIDLHKNTLHEALSKVEKLIDNALRDNVKILHIIHGKGTGTLLTHTQKLLKVYQDKDIVSSYQYANRSDGGYGKTIVFLK